LRIELPGISMRWGFVNQAVEVAISDGGIADLFVPAGDRQLRSQNQRADLVTVFADLSKVTAFLLQQ
jgi:hypothetical protein